MHFKKGENNSLVSVTVLNVALNDLLLHIFPMFVRIVVMLSCVVCFVTFAAMMPGPSWK